MTRPTLGAPWRDGNTGGVHDDIEATQPPTNASGRSGRQVATAATSGATEPHTGTGAAGAAADAIRHRELEAVTGLYATLALDAPLPPLGGWAIDALFGVLLVETILDNRPSAIVECGSGASTVLAAAALRRRAIPGHVTSLEHDATFADTTLRILRRHGLDEWATVRPVPLVDGPHGRWYDPAALDRIGSIDLLVVDGPPASTGQLARYPALPTLHERLASACTVLLDDAFRADELEVLRRWQLSYPDLPFELRWTVHGAAVGHRRA